MPLPGVNALKYAVIDTATLGDNTIVAAVTGKRLIVLTYTIVTGGAVALRWKSAANSLSGAMSFAANGGVAPAGTVEAPLLQTNPGEALVLNLGAAIQTSGHITYIEAGGF